MEKTHLFKPYYLHAITRTIFIAAGASEHIANDVAEILIKANLSGHDSHGVLRIPAYIRGINDGSIKPSNEPEIVDETDNIVRVDGNSSFGHYVSRWSIRKAIDKAKISGSCCVSIFNTGHIGRLGEYAEEAAHSGCIGLISVGMGGKGAGPVVPFGGSEGRFSTNPIALGVPTGDKIPFIVDYATSVIAEGKIQVARSKGTQLPDGCILDKNGSPSVDPAEFYDGGSLLTFGRHKGYALAMFTCLLGGLSGTFNVDEGSMKGIYMQAINVNAFTPIEEYQKGVRAFLDVIKSTSPAEGFDEVLAPGDFEARLYAERVNEGIEIPDSINDQLHECANQFSVSIDEGIIEPEDEKRYQKS